jgi:hypothetical protein
LEKLTYIFHGSILPERVNLNFSTDALTENCSFAIRCWRSKLTIECKHDDTNIDVLTLNGLVESAVSGIVDVLGYTLACGYDVSIDSVYSLATKESSIFGVHENIFDDLEINNATSNGSPHPDLPKWEDIIKIVGPSQELRIALTDFRESIKQPDFTAFHCYRVLDSLKYAAPHRKQEDKQWEWLLKELCISKKTKDMLMKAGGEQRHGKIKMTSWEERKWAMQIAWYSIQRFLYWHLDKSRLNSLPLL